MKNIFDISTEQFVQYLKRINEHEKTFKELYSQVKPPELSKVADKLVLTSTPRPNNDFFMKSFNNAKH